MGNEYKIRFQRWKTEREKKKKTVTYGLYVLYVMGKKGERKQDDCSMYVGRYMSIPKSPTNSTRYVCRY